MKKLLLGAILTLFPILASAQFSIDKVDEFTATRSSQRPELLYKEAFSTVLY